MIPSLTYEETKCLPEFIRMGMRRYREGARIRGECNAKAQRRRDAKRVYRAKNRDRSSDLVPLRPSRRRHAYDVQ